MTRGVMPPTGALVALLFAAGTTARAQIALDITPDRRVVEGNSGTVTVNLSVSISAPNTSAVTTVEWSTLDGTATAANPDFVPVSPTTLTWNVGDGFAKTISVQVLGDDLPEWNASQVDETFFVVLRNPVNATIRKPSATVTILDDDHPNDRPGVQFLSSVSGSVTPHGATNGQVLLQWRVPAAPTPPDEIVIRERVGAGCTFPTTTTDGDSVVVILGPLPAAGATQSFLHSGLELDSTRCYSVFTIYSGTPTTQVAQIKGTPFAANGAIAWKFTSPTTILAPPTVGADAIYVTDTIGVVHALQRGVGGGMWPSTWNPVAVGQTDQRSAVVPRPEGWRLFLGTKSGGVHSIDGRTGNIVWSRNTTAGTALPNLGGVQAQPAGIFRNFGGANDLLLVGTNTAVGSNAFFAIAPATGELIASLGTAAMGGVLGMPVVDYAGNRVFFLSSSSSETVFAMDLGPSGSPGLSFSTLSWNRTGAGSGANGALVLRNDRLYFGDNTDQLFAQPLAGTLYGQGTGDGPIKGFVWPDRRNDNLYFSTSVKVHGYRDAGSGFTTLWTVSSLVNPTMVLQKPGTDQLYVGDGIGSLQQIDASSGTAIPLIIESGSQLGAPSLDITHNLLIVGAETGNVYAVRVP